MNKKINKRIIVSAIVGVVIIGGGAFYVGTKYPGAKSGLAQGVNFSGQMRGGTGMGRGQGFGGTTIGEIVAKDDISITVKLRDGGSKIIFFLN